MNGSQERLTIIVSVCKAIPTDVVRPLELRPAIRWRDVRGGPSGSAEAAAVLRVERFTG